MSFWKSYNALNPRTKIFFGLGVLTWGTIGLWVSDQAEKKLGLEAGESDKQALKDSMPKITVVDRD